MDEALTTLAQIQDDLRSKNGEVQKLQLELDSACLRASATQIQLRQYLPKWMEAVGDKITSLCNYGVATDKCVLDINDFDARFDIPDKIEWQINTLISDCQGVECRSIPDLIASYKQQQKRVQELTDTLTSIPERDRDFLEKLEHFEDRKRVMADSLASKESEIRQLTETLDSKDNTIRELTDRLVSRDTLIKTHAEMDSNIHQMKDNIASKKSRMQVKEQEIQAKQQEIRAREQEILTRKQEILAKEQEIKQISSAAQTIATDTSQTWEEIKKQMREIGVSEECFANRDEKIEALKLGAEEVKHAGEESRKRKHDQVERSDSRNHLQHFRYTTAGMIRW